MDRAAKTLTDSVFVLHMFHIKETHMKIEDIRGAVADTLEARGLSNRTFLREIRTGKRDESPYMIGALACAAAQIMQPAG
ncbi:hypothetical protein TQ38_002295 [Novosphingobium sp. P6W]|nr:hypothetical protein TQ38_002295 [Novosphingobium sp. P6W]KIS32490.1 hypothetical protein TQ38_09120 [Novosphingobium sp. P6W]